MKKDQCLCVFVYKWYVRSHERAYEKVPIIIQMHYEWRPLKILEGQELEMLFYERVRVGLLRYNIIFWKKGFDSRHIRFEIEDCHNNKQFI